MKFTYQVAVLGDYPDWLPSLERSLLAATDALGIDPSHIAIVKESDIPALDPRSPTVAVFFGYHGAVDTSHPLLKTLLEDSITLIPCVAAGPDVGGQLPKSIQHINAYQSSYGDADWVRLTSLILENLRLLRAERRLFISYKRSESQTVAVQLYEAFDKAGFDVFLDTRSVPYASDFQSILWHRMADSDLVILLDTPDFRASHWTMLELAQANATNIQILHLLWPRVRADKASAFSEFYPLSSGNFRGRRRVGHGTHLRDDAVVNIITAAESLRARALAARHRSLIDNFCDQAKYSRVKYSAVQPERYISVELASSIKVAVVPTIGVPRADRYQEIEVAIQKFDPDAKQIWLLYDERGILESWVAHLDWLDDHLPVKSVKVSSSSDRLSGGGK